MDFINIFKVKDGTYVFNLKETCTLEITTEDDTKFQIKNELYDKKYQLIKYPKSIKQIITTSIVDYYVSTSNDKLRYNAINYKIELNRLLLNSNLSEDGNIIFTDIDGEYAYKKFVSNWKEVYKQNVEYKDIKIIISDLPVSEYTEIVPLYQIGGSIDNPFCDLKTTKTNLLKQICSELKIPFYMKDEYIKTGEKYVITCPSHSGLRYVKLNNNYIFSNDTYTAKNDIVFSGIYSECVEHLLSNKKYIKDIVNCNINMEDEKYLDEESRRNLLNEFTKLEEYLCYVEPTKKSSNAFQKTKQKLNDIKKIITKEKNEK